MVSYPRWPLLLLALLWGGGHVFAASREERAYAAASAAFQDHFYDRAETGLTQFLQSYRKSTNAPAALLLLAQSEFYLGKYPDAIGRLTDSNNLARAAGAGLADRYVYWRAEAQFASGELAAAAETFGAVPKNFPDSPLALTATVEAASAFGKLGQWAAADNLLDNTNGLFQRAARLDPASASVANGRLLQAESRSARTNYEAAIGILNLLNPATLTPDQDWKRAQALYRAHWLLGDHDAALAVTTNLLAIARAGRGPAWAANLAEAVANRAGVLEQRGQLTEAREMWQENLTNNAPAQQQRRAVLKMVELAEAQNHLADAESSLELYLAHSNSPAADVALLQLGELHLKEHLAQPADTNHLPLAQAKLDQFLAASTNGPLAGEAYLNRGWCRWLTGQYQESLADFQSAAALLPMSTNLVVARFKMGDAQFAAKDFAGALTNYQAVLTDFSALTNVVSSLADHALYQILRARLALHDAPGADEAMRRLLTSFATNTLTDTGRLLAGEGFSKFGSPARAREVFQSFATERTNSPLLPQARLAIGRTFEREQNWPAVVTNDQAWLAAYSTNELRPQVEYARNWAVSQTGDEAGAFELFTNFISEFSTNAALTPLAHWWVADHFFRLGTNFSEAEKNYELIFQDFPTNELAFPAQLMAGRAAMGRFGYKDAGSYFRELIKANCPEDLRDQARFGYCEALRQMSASDTNTSLQQVTNILAQVYPKAATNLVGALAWSETGDCDLQLGALDAATNAYAQAFHFAGLFDSPEAAELWCRAKVGQGLVLEKKAELAAGNVQVGLWLQARDNYLDVLDAIRGGSAATLFWPKKAGLQALELIQKIGTPDPAGFFDDLEKLFPQLKDSLEEKRMAVQNAQKRPSPVSPDL